ncbi:tyrosine-type recombinase/integrase [Pseudomonas chlororaphis]|uniref:tyrosine-type recombinase/integrase n=1 Tax=Pseudomonas chlororaphis TaxID=587753 RepID=UPI0013DDA8C4|nr:tyrosine-type recombinase/integrase [Pseudomonas chlororaphis]
MLSVNDIVRLTELFQLNNPDVTWEGSGGLRETVLGIATDLLRTTVDAMSTFKAADLREDHLQHLRELAATFPLSPAQAEAIHWTQEAYRADQMRLQQGNVEPLLRIVKALDAEPVVTSSNDSSLPANPAPTEVKKVPFKALAEGYLRDHATDLKVSSRKSIEEASRALIAVFEAIGLGDDVSGHTRADLVKARELLGQGRAVSTVNKIVAKLTAILTWAELNGLIPHNYTKGLKTSKGAKSKRKGFTEAQVDAVLAQAAQYADPQVSWICSIAAVTGARIQEIMQLRKDDVVIDPLTGLLSIDINEGKGLADDGKSVKTENSNRRVPLVTTSKWFRELEEFKAFVQGLPEGTSKLFSKGMLVDEVRGAVRAAMGDDPSLVFHSFRHTMAGLLQTHEVILQTSAAIMGHSTGSITFDTYGTKMSQQTLRDALEKVLPRKAS